MQKAKVNTTNAKIASVVTRHASRVTCHLSLVTLLLLAGCKQETATKPDASADSASILEKIAQKGPVKMTLRLSPKEPRLSDLLDLDVIVEAAPQVSVKPPPFGSAVGDFLVRDYSQRSPTTSLSPGGKEGTTSEVITHHFHYQLEPAHAGNHLIRSVMIEFTDQRAGTEVKAEPVTLESEPLEVMVTSELGDKTPSLADLAPMSAPLPLSPSPLWQAAVMGGIVIILAAAIMFWLRHRRKKEAVLARPRSPEEIAHEELRALLAANLPGRGEFKEFYVRLTGIVRRYIEGTTGIRAPEETTEEFLRDMRARQVFPSQRSGQLATFLEAADMVKYAAMTPGERQVEESIARAQEFVGLPSALQCAASGV